MLESITDLVQRGYVSAHKAEIARAVCGKIFLVRGKRCAIFRADVRCDWFWVVFEDGARGECHFRDLRLTRAPERHYAAARFRADTDHRGEWPVTRYVYEAGYSEVLAALTGQDGALVA